MIVEDKFAILASEERTGKTGTFIRVAEMSNAENVLILTKKAAIGGIQEHIENLDAKKNYVVTNYQSVHKLHDVEYDFVILDEFHQALCSYPKQSQTSKQVSKFTHGKPILFVSATPFSESYAQAFYALKLSSWTPFKHKTFYEFHREYGIEQVIFLSGRQIRQYHVMQEARMKSKLSRYILSATRRDIGFRHEPEDIIHRIRLDEATKADIKMYKKTKLKHIKSQPIPLDSIIAEMNAVYLRGGGMVEHAKECYQMSTEKVDYIMSNFGDSTDVAIMAHYVCEQRMLSKTFKNAQVFSSTAHAEGVDLHQFKDLIVYSMGFSTSKFVQRRARQCNINREHPIDVHYLLADGSIDSYLYHTVSEKKTNFTARVYQNE